MNTTFASKRFSFSPHFVRLAICGLILLAVFAIYRQCVQDQFIEFDDGMYVFRNDTVRNGLSWHNLKWALTATEAANWHPLTWWAHMLDVELFGMFAGGHVMTNVLLHGLAAVVLFLVLENITGSIGVAAFVALVFAVHPANVESVAWVSQKKSTLSALFAFLALGAYWRYGSRPSWRRYGIVVLCFTLSLLAKPMMVTFPLLACLLDFWPLHRIQWPLGLFPRQSTPPLLQVANGQSRWITWLWLIEKIPFAILAGASCIITSIVQYHAGAMGDIEHINWATRISNVLFSYLLYLKQLFLPYGHALLYPFLPSYLPALVGLCALTLTAFTWLAIRSIKRDPALFVGWFWYLLTLVPVIGLLQVGSQSMADRYLYIPMLGPILWLATLSRSWGKRSLKLQRIIRLVGIGWISALALAAWLQASFWVNSEIIIGQAIANTKRNFIMQGALGTYYYQMGRLPEAEFQYREALKTKPNDAGLLGHLAATIGRFGKYDEAIPLLKKSLRLNSKDAGNHNNLGVFYAQIGKFEDAAHEFTEAIKLKPDYTSAIGNLNAAKAHLPVQSEKPTDHAQSIGTTTPP